LTEKQTRTTTSLVIRMCIFMGAIGITAALLRPMVASSDRVEPILSLFYWGLGGAMLGLLVHLILPRK
jgi:hypothetical protein